MIGAKCAYAEGEQRVGLKTVSALDGNDKDNENDNDGGNENAQ